MIVKKLLQNEKDFLYSWVQVLFHIFSEMVDAPYQILCKYEDENQTLQVALSEIQPHSQSTDTTTTVSY
jgi:hypothetical protein